MLSKMARWGTHCQVGKVSLAPCLQQCIIATKQGCSPAATSDSLAIATIILCKVARG
jgi:hypothetical protein